MMVQRRITLTSDQHFGRRLPPEAGYVIAGLPAVMQRSVAMAFRRRSTLKSLPAWLRQATDFRFLGHEGEESTDLIFEAPLFGEAAPSLYEQQEMWPSKPAENETGFEVFADLLADITGGNRDSDRFDEGLLRRVSGLDKLFRKGFREITVGSTHRVDGHAPQLNSATVATARSFLRTIPNPRRVRLCGTLNTVRANTQGFGILLENGEEVFGVLVDGDVCDHLHLMRKPVLVIGKAVYRPSGRLLRIDADLIRPAEEKDRFFAEVPKPVPNRIDLRQLREAQGKKRGLPAVIGQWPGDETDEQIEQALKELS